MAEYDVLALQAANLRTERDTLETLRAAWEKRAYQAEANENRYRAALEELQVIVDHDLEHGAEYRIVHAALDCSNEVGRG